MKIKQTSPSYIFEDILTTSKNLISQVWSCHPTLQQQLNTPQVQSILATLPLSIFTWPLALVCDPCLCCCCCPCETYYVISTQTPINLLFLALLLVLAVIVLIILFICSIILLPFAVEIALIVLVGPIIYFYVYDWVAQTL